MRKPKKKSTIVKEAARSAHNIQPIEVSGRKCSAHAERTDKRGSPASTTLAMEVLYYWAEGSLSVQWKFFCEKEILLVILLP